MHDFVLLHPISMIMRLLNTTLFLLLLGNTTFSQEHDTLLTETARYIAGIPCETEYFKTLQQKSFYKAHSDFCAKSWEELSDSTLNPMVKWATEKNIIETCDTNTCFYPFSGPDILFAVQFFPYCSNYIMMGLERLGTMPDLKKLNEQQLSDYLGALRQSQRYLLKSGYFVTSHMSQDFSKSTLNGNIHLMAYFLIRTGFLFRKIEYGGIDSRGDFFTSKNNQGSGYFQGMRIEVVRKNEMLTKTVHYFSFDAADYKISAKSEFKLFVEKKKGFCTYIKSASYIPAHKNFSVVRNLILQHSDKILQDDTGVPYKNIVPEQFEINLWGTYTKTIKDLSWGYDPELRKALEASGNNAPLPFKISYNGNYGEGMMLYAKRKKN